MAGFSQHSVSQSGTNAGSFSGGPQSTTLSAIPDNILIEVLTAAAPYYGFSASTFIQMYRTCGCIVVEQIGPNTYRVEYGGLGIQIIIDGSRNSNGAPWSTTPGTKR